MSITSRLRLHKLSDGNPVSFWSAAKLSEKNCDAREKPESLLCIKELWLLHYLRSLKTVYHASDKLPLVFKRLLAHEKSRVNFPVESRTVQMSHDLNRCSSHMTGSSERLEWVHDESFHQLISSNQYNHNSSVMPAYIVVAFLYQEGAIKTPGDFHTVKLSHKTRLPHEVLPTLSQIQR